MNLQKLGIILTIAISTAITAAGTTRAWEEMAALPERLPGPPTEIHIDTPDEVYSTVSEGYVYVVVRQRMQVKIFTILGQPVVQQTLQPGIYRYKLSSRGIYLLKAGSSTKRINN